MANRLVKSSVVIVLSLVATVAVSCGSKAKLQFNPVTADLTAHNALIQTNALPGAGWSITNEDPKESDDPGVDTDNCKPINAFQDETKEFDKKNRAARAKRVISRPVPRVPLPTTVNVEIEIYKQTSGLKKHLTEVRKLVDDGIYTKCFGDLLTDVFKKSNLTATTKSVYNSAPAPDNGFSFAAEAQVQGLATPIRFENYGWLVGNAKVTVSFSGSQETITPELVKAAIEKTQDALAAANATTTR